MKYWLIALALPLAACQTAQTTPVASAGTTVAAVPWDLQALDTVWKAYDVAQDGINLLIDAKVIKPGTPLALQVADANDKVKTALLTAKAARNAKTAVAAQDYSEALADAQEGLKQLHLLIGGLKK